jgi:Uma2 family endonuclease
MVEAKITMPRTLPAGQIVALDIAEADYMRDYAESFHEWVEGVVVKMSPVSGKHDELTAYLRILLDTYFALKPLGKVRSAPFVMRIKKPKSRREPDLQVILHSNPGKLEATYMDGAADICIEVVSPGSESTDYGDKFKEYEQGGVREYWIIDPLRRECRFHRLVDTKLYKQIIPDEDYYETPLLPQFKFHVPTLWEDTLPDVIQIVAAVKAMVDQQ